MSNTTRNLFLLILVFLLVVAAFAAGYVANEFVDLSPDTARAAANEESFSLFWEAWGWVEKSYLGEIPPMKQVTYGAIRGALNSLGDPYTVFIEPPARDQERDSLRGNFGGIGAHLTRNEAGEVVLDPIPGNPAEAAGVVTGDVLLAVDGQPIGDAMTVQEIAQLIRGEKGTTVTLTVRHPEDEEPVELTIERDDILIPSVSYRLLEEAPATGYIQLTRFSGESSNEVREAILDLGAQGAERLIVDVRGNGGGLLDAAVDVADHFLSGGPVLYQESKGEGEQVYEATEETLAADIPLVVLVDGGTASSAEILAGALQDRDRATLMGTQTFGKGSVQLVYDLSDGSSVHVTASRWYTPNRHQIDQQGLTPDIPVEMTQEAIDAGRDVVLERAVEYLQSGND
ncbi:MAG: S41 family peptidase [Candidatus Promineifilaceae bacterium]|nr:S41 family peptidase [Candidatus Promineifilaceae bacterium]